NPDKNAFHCFSCEAKGNVLDFVAAMEKCSIRDAGVKLQQWFNVPAERREQPDKDQANKRPEADTQLAAEEIEDSAEANQPLKFTLKGIDPTHAYLAERRITEEAAQEFGVGFFSGKGSMAGRCVIPIHNANGELVAYAGRSID